MMKLLGMMVDWHPFWFVNLFYSTEANTSYLGIFDEFCRIAQQEQRELLENENNCFVFIQVMTVWGTSFKSIRLLRMTLGSSEVQVVKTFAGGFWQGY